MPTPTTYFFNLFILVLLGLCSFVDFSLVAASGGYSLVGATPQQGLLPSGGAWASPCSGPSCCEAQAPGHTGFSGGVTWARQLWLTQAQLLHGTWGLPDQRPYPCPLHWQVGSLPPSYQRSTHHLLNIVLQVLDRAIRRKSKSHPTQKGRSKTVTVRQ